MRSGSWPPPDANSHPSRSTAAQAPSLTTTRSGTSCSASGSPSPSFATSAVYPLIPHRRPCNLVLGESEYGVAAFCCLVPSAKLVQLCQPTQHATSPVTQQLPASSHPPLPKLLHIIKMKRVRSTAPCVPCSAFCVLEMHSYFFVITYLFILSFIKLKINLHRRKSNSCTRSFSHFSPAGNDGSGQHTAPQVGQR